VLLAQFLVCVCVCLCFSFESASSCLPQAQEMASTQYNKAMENEKVKESVTKVSERVASILFGDRANTFSNKIQSPKEPSSTKINKTNHVM
jgi:hypothetical protein